MGMWAGVIYSSADENALHVRMADEAFFVGPAPARESYLNIQSILKIAKENGIDAIHPGYGFLSENAKFAEEVKKAGMVFIGPSPKAIALMGDKLEAKRLAKSAGVPCLPGTDEALDNLNEAGNIATSIGFPVMVKAAAGGGGKGMRIIQDESQLDEGLKGAMHEAEASFGDKRLFLEKYIESARHIEIQVLSDLHGNIIHLGERECSLQRRHQKVIEEAPSPFVTIGLRDAMTAAALRLAKAVKYTTVGTVEFVVDQQKNFYFLEMNTRLQVEHPTTEMITGFDLVEEMIRAAAGEHLRFKQSDVQLKGHAIEARIYAEDSTRGFLPSTGRLKSYIPPSEIENEIRIDSGVGEGDIISPYYDPLIGKLIVHESTRERACDTLLNSLDRFYIRGIETNINFLGNLVNSKQFKTIDFDTTTLDEKYPQGFMPVAPTNPLVAVGTAAVIHVIRKREDRAEICVLMDRENYPVRVFYEGSRFEVQGKESLVIETDWVPGDPIFEGVFNGHGISIQIDNKGTHTQLSWNGQTAVTLVLENSVAELFTHMPCKKKQDLSRVVLAPMPGLIVEVYVREGDHIKAGQPVATIEAMKMENIIRAESDGIIESIFVKQGESVNLDQRLAMIE